MSNISRSQWYNQQISTFLSSTKNETFILLYCREIKKVAKSYPELTITTVACAGLNDNRKVCHLAK